VDSYLIPLDEIKRAPGDDIRLAYWGSSVLPRLTINSVGFESPGLYYSFSLPKDKFHSLKLAGITGQINASLVPDPRAEQSSEPEKITPTPPLGEAPPEVVAADWLNTDAPQSLAGLKGSVVLVEFWATWCGPCVAGIPHLNELQEKYRKQGLRILSFTDQDRETVENFQKKTTAPIEYTVGLGSQLFKAYGVTGIPHAFVVTRDGKLLWHGHPAAAECEAKIAEALAPE
jgi:thiol-disulfide isomerase/thioredoxin